MYNNIYKNKKKVFFKRYTANNLYSKFIINSLDGYDLDYIEKEINKENPKAFLDEFRRIILVRIVNVLAFQIKHKKNIQYLSLLEKLLIVLLEDLLSPWLSSGADFYLIELYMALNNSKDIISSRTHAYSIELLTKVKPFENYQIHCRNTKINEQHNFVIYSIVGEYLRGKLTNTDTSEYINENWKVQKEKFDDNGMYRDPNNPILYDLTVRAHLAYMLHCGYDGPIKEDIISILENSSMITLHYMSTQFVFPYGGRSNSYHMNEALVAAICEFYAGFYFSKGKKTLAGSFNRLARKSILNLDRYKGHHLKNFFDIKDNFGCDPYGTYEGYMVTSGCFLNMGFEMNNKKIPEYYSPSELGGYVLNVSKDFHKVFANVAGYFIEIDYNADMHYDSNGLSRIHKKNIPIELGLSMPFAKNAKYNTNGFKQNKGRAIGPMWYENNEAIHLAESKLIKESKINIVSESMKELVFDISYYIKEGQINEKYTISKKGIQIDCSSNFATINYHIPLLVNNGKDTPSLKVTNKYLKNHLKKYEYFVKWNKFLSCSISNDLIYNRSGIYKSLIINGNSNNLSLNIKLRKKLI